MGGGHVQVKVVVRGPKEYQQGQKVLDRIVATPNGETGERELVVLCLFLAQDDRRTRFLAKT